MDIGSILVLLAGKFPLVALILMALGAVVVLAQVIIPLTPSTADDEAWAKILNVPILGKILLAFVAFAPIQKK